MNHCSALSLMKSCTNVYSVHVFIEFQGHRS